MKRIKGWAASVLMALLVVCPGTAVADTLPLGDTGYFVAGVKSEEFVHFAAPESAGKQRMENWCWAACIQMVLNYHGLYVDQQDIVTRIYGAAIDRPANGDQIMAALTGWAPDTRGRRSQIYADNYNLDAATIINDLDKKWPLIVGLRGARGAATGHAYVMTAAYFSKDQSGQPTIHRVVLRDPFPGYQSRIELDAQEFGQRLQFATRVYVERL
ncbi:MAG: C39 family peptidase [Candidatus Eremiobacteraeota bacterium]|nr:C39 family peptidase [Candidatus Eremiobacteraeota bacterium]